MSIKNNTTSLQDLLDAVNALPEAGSEQATPVISVNPSNGLITATAGIKSSTHQLAFQPAKTITPGTASQIAVSSGYYTGGDITVAGDSNLVAGNIKSGVSIFGINGTLVEGGGSNSDGNTDIEDSLITRTISSYTNDRVKTIGAYAFASCSNLTSINFPACTSIGAYAFKYCSSLTLASFPTCTSIGSNAFAHCSNLTSVNFPACTSIGGFAFNYCSKLTSAGFPICTLISSYAFSGCSKLTSVSFPVCVSIGGSAFAYCSNLTSVNFPACTSIGTYAFNYCSKLASVNLPVCTAINNGVFARCYTLSQFYLTGSSVCKLSNSNAFSSTPYAGYSSYFSGTPYIYVPSSLLTSYQTATNWTYFSSYFSAVEDAP